MLPIADTSLSYHGGSIPEVFADIDAPSVPIRNDRCNTMSRTFGAPTGSNGLPILVMRMSIQILFPLTIAHEGSYLVLGYLGG